MKDPSRKQILLMATRIKDECNELISLAESMNKEWLTYKEFAKQSRLGKQTVSNYLSQRRFGEKQKRLNGKWHIHRSALSNYN